MPLRRWPLSTAIGGASNGTGAPTTTGFRTINWDGVPDAFAAPNQLPANFFNVNSPRGAVLSTSGTGFEVSATAASGTATLFGDIDATYTTTFTAFSPERIFTPLGSNVTDVSFFVPGTSTAAVVSGFGAIFTDVDLANNAYSEPQAVLTAVGARSFTAVRARRSVVLRWRAPFSPELLGFNIWRVGRARSVRLNRRLGQARSGGGSYRYVAPLGGRGYRLQAVNADGSRRWVAFAAVS
jgi:hypothetical protein